MILTEQKQPDQYKLSEPTEMDKWCNDINIHSGSKNAFGDVTCHVDLSDMITHSFSPAPIEFDPSIHAFSVGGEIVNLCDLEATEWHPGQTEVPKNLTPKLSQESDVALQISNVRCAPSKLIVEIKHNGEVILGDGITAEHAAHEFWMRLVAIGSHIHTKLERLAYLEGELLAKETSTTPPASEVDDMYVAYERAKKAVQ